MEKGVYCNKKLKSPHLMEIEIGFSYKIPSREMFVVDSSSEIPSWEGFGVDSSSKIPSWEGFGVGLN